MTTASMGSVLSDTRALLSVKTAELEGNVAGTKEAAGLDTGGAGDDSPVTRGHVLEVDEPALDTKKEPAVSADADADAPGPEGGTTGGAEGKDEDNETDRSNTLGAEDAPPASVAKKPAETGDAFAKECSDGPAKLANDIVGAMRAIQEADKTEKPAEAPKVAEKVDTPPAEAPPAEGKAAAEQHGLNLEVTSDMLQKIGALVLADTEGENLVEKLIARHEGQKSAEATLDFLAKQASAAEQVHAEAQGAADADALVAQQIYQEGYKAGAAGSAPTDPTDPTDPEFWAKLGQMAADESIQGLMGAGELGMGGGGADVPPAAMDPGAGAALPPEGMPPAVEEAPPAEGLPPEGGGDEVSIEEIIGMIQQMVQAGEITPEEAEEIVSYLEQAGAGEEAPPAEAPPAEAPLAEAPPAEAPVDEPVAEEPPAEVDKAAAELLALVRAAKTPEA